MSTHDEHRFRRALHYLHSHYDRDIDLNRLAAEAALSPWHWHRRYRALMGETPYQTLKWQRLHHAAWLLRNNNRPIAAIARACGYGGNAQSFTRIFARAYGLSPQAYRDCHRRDHYPVEITTLAPVPVAILKHEGHYLRLTDTFHQLRILLSLRGHSCRESRAFSIHIPPVFARRGCYIAVTLPPAHIAPPLHSGTIAGGEHAVLHYHGTYADLDHAGDWLLHHYLPQCGETAADAPIHLEYLDAHHDDPQQQYRVDICVPLARRKNPLPPMNGGIL